MPTKSLLDGVDLVGQGYDFVATYGGCRMVKMSEWPEYYEADYTENLRTALIAALRVIDTFVDPDDAMYALSSKSERIEAMTAELEIALRVFRKGGGGDK